MFSVRIYTLIFCLLASLAARAEPKCDVAPLDAAMQARVDACWLQYHADECEKQFPDDPGARANLVRDCSPAGLRLEDEGPGEFEGCWKGLQIYGGEVAELVQLAFDGTVAIAKGVVKMQVVAAQGLMNLPEIAGQTVEAHRRWLEEIEKNDSIEKRRELVTGIAYLEKMNDAQLMKMSPYELRLEIEKFRNVEETAAITDLPTVVPQGRPPRRADFPSLGEAAHAVADWVASQFAVKARCLKPAPRAAYDCYMLTTALTAGLPAGVAKTAAKSGLKALEKGSKSLYEALKVEKLAEGSGKIAGRLAAGAARRARSASTGLTSYQRKYRITKFVNRYKNLKLTDKADNKLYAARIGRRASDGQGVLVEESAVLKKINTATKNPAIADAVNNRFKELLFQNEEAFAAKYGVDTQRYAAYKEGNLAVDAEEYRRFQEFSTAIHEESMREFLEDRDIRALCEDYGLDPAELMRAGTGPTHVEAKAAAREGRRQGDPFKVTDARDPQVQMSQRSGLVEADRAQARLTRTLRETEVMQKIPDERFPGTWRYVPSQKTFELVRKYQDDPQKLRAQIKKVLKVDVSTDETETLIQYARGVDRFATDAPVLNPESLSLPEAKYGVTAIDLPGIGAANQAELAKRLSSAHGDLPDAFTASGKAEEEVTYRLNQIRRDFKSVTRDVVGDGAEVINSGDDIFIVYTKPITAEKKAELVRRLAEVPGYGPPRFATSPAGVASVKEAESLLQHGLSLEKTMREHLAGEIDWRRLENVSISFDMSGVKAGTGEVALKIATRNGVKLTQEEETLIRARFRSALAQFNNEKTNAFSYTPAP